MTCCSIEHLLRFVLPRRSDCGANCGNMEQTFHGPNVGGYAVKDDLLDHLLDQRPQEILCPAINSFQFLAFELSWFSGHLLLSLFPPLTDVERSSMTHFAFGELLQLNPL